MTFEVSRSLWLNGPGVGVPSVPNTNSTSSPATGWPGGLVRCRYENRTGRSAHPAKHAPTRKPVRDVLAAAAGDGDGASRVAPGVADAAERAVQPGDRRQCRQPGSLAEPLARGAPIVELLPERFRR